MRTRGSLSVITDMFRGYGWYLIAMTVLGILTAAADGASVAAIIPIVSLLVPSGSASAGGTIMHAMQAIFGMLHVPYQFRYMLLFVAALIIGRALLMAVFVGLRAYASSTFLARQIGDVYGELLQSRWQFILREKGGHLQNIILWDTKRAGNLLDSVIQFLQSSTGFLVYLCVALTISPAVTLVTLCAGAVLGLGLRPAMRRTRSFSAESVRLEKDISQHITEHVHAFKTVKAAGIASAAHRVVSEYLTRFRNAQTKATLVQSIGSICIQPFGFLLAMAIFAYSYYSGTFNVAAFAATIYLIQKIFVYLDSTQGAVGTILQFVPFAAQVLEFKERARAEREEIDSREGAPFSFQKSIEYAHVSLRYEGGAHALTDVSFAIPEGSMIALVGPSGSGKTSIADLLLRLFEPQAGDITVDGRAARTISIDAWRRAVAYVSQDSFLLHTTVRDNIRFYDESVTNEDIERAAKQAHIYDEIMRLPQGFDTVLGDRGATISGGQRQRIALARALARKPQVLVLDEVTSALDSELEAQIRQAIAELRGTLTLVVIAHRISTVLDADQIIVMNNGRVAEVNAPSAMLANANSYLSRMLAMQGK